MGLAQSARGLPKALAQAGSASAPFLDPDYQTVFRATCGAYVPIPGIL
jgi:hypothetical protein